MLRLEAWTLPDSGSFTKVVGPIPYDSATIAPRFNGVGSGSFVIPYGYSRRKDILDPANNVETIIRAFDGQTEVYAFFARTSEVNWATEGGITIAGPGIESALDHALVYPFDWSGSDNFPASEATGESTFLDTVYGGDNILSNPGFENGLKNEVQGISHDYRATTTLSGAIDDVQTSLTVADGSTFPPSDFRIEIGSEWIHVATRTGNTFSGLTRGIEGTSASGHSDASEVLGGGWFTLTYSGATTGRLEWNATAEEIEFELQALGNIIEVGVQGDGTVNLTPWLIEFIDPGEQNNPMLTANTANLTPYGGGTQFNIVEKLQGGVGDPRPWTKSYDPNTEFVHGGYAAFQVGSVALYGDPAHTGDKAMGIQPEVPTPQGEDNYPGVQQIVPVQPASILQANAWVYPTVNMKISLVVRDLNEKEVKKVSLEMGAGVWQQISALNVTIPVNVNQVLFRVAAENPADAATFWIDDCEFNEGYQPSTIGRIVLDMRTFATAQGRDTIDWIDFSSFDDINDSDGVAWNDVVSAYLAAGSSWRSILDQFARQGYEWRVVWNGTAYALQIFNPGGMGTTITGKAFSSARIQEALVRSSSPSSNVLLGEGAHQKVAEVSDAALVAAYGRREGFINDADALDIQTLTAALEHSLDERRDQKTTAKLTLDDTYHLGTDFALGDFVSTEIPGEVAKASYRIKGAQITITGKDVSTTVDIGKYVFPRTRTTSSVTSDAVNWLLRQKRKIQRLERITADLANVVPDPQEYTSGGGGIPWLVAASNAPQSVKDFAGYVCDGVDDHVQIADALGTYFKVVLSEGNFFCDTNQIFMGSGQSLSGQGIATWIRPQNEGVSVSGRYLIQTSTDCSVSDISFSSAFVAGWDGRCLEIDYSRATNIVHYGPAECALYVRGAQQPITNITIHGGYSLAGIFVDEGWCALNGIFNLPGPGGGPGIFIDSSAAANVIINNFVCSSFNNSPGIKIEGGNEVTIVNCSITNGSNLPIEMALGAVTKMVVAGCYLEGDYGLSITDASTMSQVVISDCVIDGLLGGIRIDNASADRTVIANNYFHSTQNEAIFIEGAGRLVISGNMIFDSCVVSGSAAIHIDGTTDSLQRGIVIHGNKIDACISDGIYVTGKQHISIKDNHLTRVRRHQYRFNNCDQGIVSGNYADPDANALSPSDGILLEGDTNELLITNNKLVPDIDGVNSRWGINISAATCDDNIVVLNDLRPSADWASGALNDAGTGTVTTVPTGNFT